MDVQTWSGTKDILGGWGNLFAFNSAYKHHRQLKNAESGTEIVLPEKSTPLTNGHPWKYTHLSHYAGWSSCTFVL